MDDPTDNNPPGDNPDDLDDWLAFLAGQRPQGFDPDALDESLRSALLNFEQRSGSAEGRDELGWQRMQKRLRAEGLLADDASAAASVSSQSPRYVWPSLGIAASAVLAVLLLWQTPMDDRHPQEISSPTASLESDAVASKPADERISAANQPAAKTPEVVALAEPLIRRKDSMAEMRSGTHGESEVPENAGDSLADRDAQRRDRDQSSAVPATGMMDSTMAKSTAAKSTERTPPDNVMQLDLAINDPETAELREWIEAQPDLTIVKADVHDPAPSWRIRWDNETAKSKLRDQLTPYSKDPLPESGTEVDLNFIAPDESGR